jgi:predicted AAA+ superfamily ATPase
MIIPRKQYLDALIRTKDKNVIKVITGIRRCGKSTMFGIFQDYLENDGVKKNNIINVNLEDGDFRMLRTADALYEYVTNRLQDGVNYVFLDEVQQVPEFQKAVDWLYTKKNIDLYITGSNAYLLSGELATLLSGRYIAIKMMPLSFKEYASAFSGNNDIQSLYRNYIMNSSFPQTLEFSDRRDIKEYLSNIYDTVILKDIIMRRKINDPPMLESVIAYMFDNIGCLCSTRKIAGTMTSAGRSISVPTVEAYLSALTDSFMMYRVGRYDVKGKRLLTTGAKYYAADIGLRYFLLGTKQADTGKILENIVYLELIRRGYEVYVGKADTLEIDFIATGEHGIEYYQVSATVLSEETLRRELTPLESVHDHAPKFLLTMDMTPENSYNGIRQINVFDWLLQTNN